MRCNLIPYNFSVVCLTAYNWRSAFRFKQHLGHTGKTGYFLVIQGSHWFSLTCLAAFLPASLHAAAATQSCHLNILSAAWKVSTVVHRPTVLAGSTLLSKVSHTEASIGFTLSCARYYLASIVNVQVSPVESTGVLQHLKEKWHRPLIKTFRWHHCSRIHSCRNGRWQNASLIRHSWFKWLTYPHNMSCSSN